MAKAQTKLVRDPDYTELAGAYQALQADTLNAVLQKNGVEDPHRRHEICKAFAYAFGTMHDQRWLQAGGRTVYPLICFAPRFLDTDTNIDKLGDVAAPSEDFAWHEHVSGALSRYFEDAHESLDVISGIVGYEISPAHCRKVKQWLERQWTAQEATAHFREKDERGDGCTYDGGWLQTFQQVISAAMRSEDQVWRYTADAKAWANLRGEMGFALVRDGAVVAYIVTGKS